MGHTCTGNAAARGFSGQSRWAKHKCEGQTGIASAIIPYGPHIFEST